MSFLGASSFLTPYFQAVPLALAAAGFGSVVPGCYPTLAGTGDELRTHVEKIGPTTLRVTGPCAENLEASKDLALEDLRRTLRNCTPLWITPPMITYLSPETCRWVKGSRIVMKVDTSNLKFDCEK